MSKSSSTTIECPKCGNSQSFTIWNSINTDIDPTLKDSLVNRKLQQTDCEVCGHSSVVNYPMLYHDMSHKTLVYHLSGLNVEQLEAEEFEHLFDGYEFRTVDNWNGMIEKIKLLDANLDDRAIELFKMVVLGQLEVDLDSPLYFDEMLSNPEGKPVLSFILVGDEAARSFSVPMESFEHFEERVAASLDEIPLDDGKWQRIDRAYARDILDQST